MKNKIFSIIFIVICIILALELKVSARNIVSTDKEVNSGDGNVTITITSKQPLGSYAIDLTDANGLELISASGGTVSADNKKITGSSTDGVTTLGSYTFKVPTVSQDTTYNIKFHASIMEDPNGNSIEDEDNTAVLTVKAKVETPPANNTTDNNSNSNNNNTTTQEKSSEARLRDFGITPNDFSGFKRDTYEYNVEVPNNVAEVEVYARTLDSNAKIKSGTGKISLKEGQNKAEVVVVAEDGKTTKTYTLNITRQSAETPAEPETEPTTQPTTEPTTENTNEEKLGLSSLTVNQMNLKPNFSTDTYEYTIELTQDLNSLEIEAKPNKDTAIVEIFGNENLQQGENLITIIVSDTSSEENTIYQITVNKNLSEKEVVSSVDWLDPATWGFKQYLIVGTVIVLIIIIIIAIILKIKLSKMDDEDDIEFPGVKELDKAMSEHQELTNSEEENKKEVKNIEPENYDTKQKLDEFFNNEEKESTPKKKGKHF